MLVYYKLSGVNAVVALIFNLVILLGLMAYIGAVMTLPGIAGFVLTMGIGVDSNVLIFERIKEELEAQRGVRASINAGFSRVFWTLVDTHIAALISAAFLFQFGTGPIRGFAVTLFFGLVVEPVHVDFRVEDAVRARRSAQPAAGRDAVHLDAMHIFKNTNYDFLRWRWHAIALSWVDHPRRHRRRSATKGIPRGVEFAGGTVVIVAVRPAAVGRAGARARSTSTSRRRPERRRPDLRRSGAAPGDGPRAAGRRRVGRVAEHDARSRSSERCSKGNLGNFKRQSAPRSSARRSARS